MNTLYIVIGLVFEVLGVLVMICGPLSEVQLKKIIIIKILFSKPLIFLVPLLTLSISTVVLIYKYGTPSWPWLLWITSLFLALSFFPLIVILALKYSSWGVNKPMNYTRIFHFQIFGFILLAIGFSFQTLGSALSSHLSGT